MIPIVKMAMALLMVAGLGAATSPASAADNPTPANPAPGNPMKICGARYQEAKTAGTLPVGQTWPQFLAQCRAALPRPATAATSRPAGPAGAKPARSAAQTATAQRQHQCGDQWKADKAAGKIPVGQTWPQYWSACNKRLK